MSDNQRNTTTNESDSDTAGTAGVEDMETAERDTVGAEVTGTAGTPASEGVEESGDDAKAPAEPEAEPESGKAPAAVEEPVAPVSAPAEPAEEEPVTEDRAEAGGTPVTETKASVPEGPNAVKATLSSRKAHLTVSRVEPWSVMKFSFVVSLVCFIVLFVAIAVIYATLSMLGVFEELTSMIDALLEGDGGDGELGLNPAAWFSPGRVLGYTGVVGALNIVLITALSTVGAMVYNLVADLVGGVDVTLSEAE
ncbi:MULTISPECIES: DUF3566 domain-containing protein [Nocardiopsidaceae]|uniref:DUF3566 domain-containing protein n=2 Tax=Nocardiopsidaceae TaxID=83676 RepID=A0ABY6YMJ1_9ACTN|nr:DUF3566 domain-containing protein [Streptomonospora nanhaiensis]WAE73577.1 DUF3566 domain-containing protein [Streptomonospora nanhaiensis]